jgi:hypothetical protein
MPISVNGRKAITENKARQSKDTNVWRVRSDILGIILSSEGHNLHGLKIASCTVLSLTKL